MELVKSDRYEPQSGKSVLETISPHQEDEFQNWYKNKAVTLGLDPNPDDPRHYYDYRSAHKAGIDPQMRGDHFGSPFKRAGHPDRYLSLPELGYIDTKTMKPEVPNAVSTITGKPTSMKEELRGTGERGINSGLLSTLDILEGKREDPRWQMAAWQKGKDPSTKLGILKGLALDIINLPKEQINPTILRNQYKALHKLPTETITENVDRLAFVPEITASGKQSYAPGVPFDYTWGNHRYHPITGKSEIKLNPGTNELTHRSQAEMVEFAAPWNRTPMHEVTHSMTSNPDNLMKIEDPVARKYMRELINLSDKQKYVEKSTERIPKEMESWQKAMEGAGAGITHKRLKSHLSESIRRERILQEIKQNRNK
jgi:hypothetical protein